jgi:hypothetical protein
MNKKDMIIVALATFCLTSTLFMILPSRGVERDPWADTSGPIQGQPDGTINMRDINYEIQHFNQDVSNMTRNVTIAGHSNKLAYSLGFTVLDPWQSLVTPWISVDGYSKITVCIDNGAWGGAHNNYTLRTMHNGGNELYSMVVDTQIDFGEYLVQTYDVPNQLVQIVFVNNDSGPNYIVLDVYLIP